MSGYVTASDLRTFGITDPKAIDLVPQASAIIDLYVPSFPVNDDGFKFPRVANDVFGIPDDNAVIPASIKTATCEQVLWMLQEGSLYVRRGGDNALTTTLPGYSKTKSENTTPLLAPLARLHIRKYMYRVGYSY